MGTKRTRSIVRNDDAEKLSVPPGFASLTSFTLKSVGNVGDAAVGRDLTEAEQRGAILSNSDITKLKASFQQKPWILHNQSGCGQEKSSFEFDEVFGRCDPEKSCMPVIQVAPVFHPSDEEFKNPLNYIASIRPKVENHGMCRIVPPPSWGPPCLLRKKKTWKTSKFGTHIQQINGLRDLDLNKVLAEFEEDSGRCKPQIDKFCAKGSNVKCGPEFTLESFQEYADEFKKTYFSKKDKDTDRKVSSISFQEQLEPSTRAVEDEYWRMMENPSQGTEVLRGTNFKTEDLSTGFPTKADLIEMPASNKYVESGWNLNNVNKLPGSLLSFGSTENPAILVPQLFIGMCFASQFWKVEEHHLYSLCYLHLGAPRIWYCVPGTHYFKFVEAVKKHFPHYSEHPELLNELVAQLPPSILTSEGIPVFCCIQNRMEFIITFPGAYHTEFDSGFNCYELVNFAPSDWLPHGQNIVELYSEHGRRTSISHDKLLLGAAMETLNNQLWRNACKNDGFFAKAFRLRIKLEGNRRKYLCNNISELIVLNDLDAATKRKCSVCLYDLYLSGASCSCSIDKFSCLRHAKQLCSCGWSSRKFFFRYQIKDLDSLVQALEGKDGEIMKAVSSQLKQDGIPVLDENTSAPKDFKDVKPNTFHDADSSQGLRSSGRQMGEKSSSNHDIIILSDDD